MSVLGLKDKQREKIPFADIIGGKGLFDNPTLAKAIAIQETANTQRDDYEVSVTELLDDARHRELSKRYEVFVPVESMITRSIGSLFHSWLAATPNGTINEVAVGKEIQGVSYGGHVDAYHEEIYAMFDNKTTTAFQYTKKLEEFYPQVWDYQWLMEANGKPVETIELRFWIRDASLSKSWTPPLTPVVAVQLADLSEREADINKRMTEYLKYRHAPDNELPLCESKWPNKDGDLLRCLYYCDVADICKSVGVFNPDAAIAHIINLFDGTNGHEWLATECPEGIPQDRESLLLLYKKAKKEKDNGILSHNADSRDG
jgi:hypothetical protein